jgi:uncharacterized delta-60 repeat protein
MRSPRVKTALLLAFLAALAAPPAALGFEPGDMDPSFGKRGAATATAVKQFKASTSAVAVDDRGRILVATTISTEPPSSPVSSGYFGTQIRVSRFLAGGRPDRSFGRAGTAALSVGPNGTEARDIAVAPDGGVAVAGRTTFRADMPRCCTWVADWDFMVARLDERGRPMWSATRDDGLSGVATAVAFDPSGGVLAGGSSGVGRYGPDGGADSGYGDAGLAAGPGRVADIAVTAGGGALVAGTQGRSPVVALLDSSGALDPAFGEGGAAGIPAAPIALALDAAGGATVLGRRQGAHSVLRIGADGALDAGFGSGGVTQLGGNPLDIAVDPAGRAVLPTAGGRLLRLGSDGRRDQDFGTPRFPGLDPRAVTVAADGKVIAAGVARTFDDADTDWQDRFGPLAARYHSDPAPGSAGQAPAPARQRQGRGDIATGHGVSPAAEAAR